MGRANITIHLHQKIYKHKTYKWITGQCRSHWRVSSWPQIEKNVLNSTGKDLTKKVKINKYWTILKECLFIEQFHKESEKTSLEWKKKIFAIHIMIKNAYTQYIKIYKSLLKKKKITRQPNRKMGKRLEQALPQKRNLPDQ